MPFVFNPVFISLGHNQKSPPFLLPDRFLNVLAHIRLFVAHRYLSLAVVSVFVSVP